VGVTNKFAGRIVVSLIVAALLLVAALILSVVEQYLFGGNRVLQALGYLGLDGFAERLFQLAQRLYPA